MKNTNQKNEDQQLSLFSRFRKLVDTADIRTLIYVPLIAAFIILLGFGYIGPKIYQGTIPLKHTAIMMACFSFLIGLTGLAQVYKREMPLGSYIVRGAWPIISGILILLMFWLSSVYSLYYALFGN